MRVLGCLGMLLLTGIFVVLSFGFSILNLIMRFFGINLPDLTGKDNIAEPSNKEPQSKKTIPDDEGEYVEFEEVE
ncbi:MAG: hypothetical protein IJK45_07370 [Bacteroidaceae bacterium]|nr:hypothetical protein [Bacteroidaceae bacterium]